MIELMTLELPDSLETEVRASSPPMVGNAERGVVVRPWKKHAYGLGLIRT